MKGREGFSLLELMVVVVLIGILLAMATLYFMRLNEQYQVESLTKELYATLMRARNNAATSKVQWVVNVAGNAMQYGRDAHGAAANTPPDNSIDNLAGDPTPGVIQSPRFTVLSEIGSPPVAVNRIVFDRRGVANQVAADGITLNPIPVAPPDGPLVLRIPKASENPGGYSGNVDPVMDCVVIESTRINIGKMENLLGVNTCVQR